MGLGVVARVPGGSSGSVETTHTVPSRGQWLCLSQVSRLGEVDRRGHRWRTLLETQHGVPRAQQEHRWH